MMVQPVCVVHIPSTGVQTRIQDIQANAVYVHCAAHIANLNLVLNDAMSQVTEVNKYLSLIQTLTYRPKAFGLI